MTCPGPSWYVVQTQPHSEMKACSHLLRQGFGVYLPRYLKRRRHARRIETVPAPLFPRYMFVSFDIAVQRWRSIRSTVGISALVGQNDSPTSVPDNIVEGLRCREDEAGFVRLELAAALCARRQGAHHRRRVRSLPRPFRRRGRQGTRRRSSRAARPQGAGGSRPGAGGGRLAWRPVAPPSPRVKRFTRSAVAWKIHYPPRTATCRLRNFSR